MENPLINHHHLSCSPLAPNNYKNDDDDNNNDSDDYIEMFAYRRSGSYTSLKDMMTSSPPMSTSSPNGGGGSWREIPIKDPLLQHAAWAYLQPIEAARDEHARWWEKCVGCVNDVVSVVISWFSEQGSDRGENDERVD